MGLTKSHSFCGVLLSLFARQKIPSADAWLSYHTVLSYSSLPMESESYSGKTQKTPRGRQRRDQAIERSFSPLANWEETKRLRNSDNALKSCNYERERKIIFPFLVVLSRLYFWVWTCTPESRCMNLTGWKYVRTADNLKSRRVLE
jgi:hypothetical protein